MQNYELTIIFTPDLTEKEIDAIIKKLGVEVISTQQWGKRLLAYPINKHKEGTYIHYIISAKTDSIKGIEQTLNHHEHVIRYLLINNGNAVTQ